MAQVDVQYVRYCVDGSTARKYLPAFPKKHVKTSVQHARKSCTRICVDPVAILGIAVAVCMLVMMVVGVFELKAVQQKAMEMDNYVTRLTAQNKLLKNQYETGYDLEDIEQTAMALGLVPREEVPEYVICVTEPQETQTQTATVWERVGAFLTDLFA